MSVCVTAPDGEDVDGGMFMVSSLLPHSLLHLVNHGPLGVKQNIKQGGCFRAGLSVIDRPLHSVSPSRLPIPNMVNSIYWL